MNNPATGAQVVFGWARERDYNVPGVDPFVFLKPIPPASMGLLRNEVASPEINASGMHPQGVPGGITGPLDLAMAARVSDFLEPLENLLGACEKTELEPGVFRYRFTPNRTLPKTSSLHGVYCEPPVNRRRLFGIKLSSVAMTIGANALIPARFAGVISHGTKLSTVAADAANTGTYPGPEIRGPLGNWRPGEKVAISITRDTAGGGVQFTAERYVGGSPTFPGNPIDVAYDSDGNGTWRDVLVARQLSGTSTVAAAATAVVGVGTKYTTELSPGKYLALDDEASPIESIEDDTHLTLQFARITPATGLVGYVMNEDAGYFDENRDPLQIIFPGDATDHADLEIGDVYVFDTAWSDPVPDYLPGQRFTSAHLDILYGRLGADPATFVPMNVLTLNPTLAWPVTPDVGNGSRYPFALDRDTELAPVMAATRKYRDQNFEEFAIAHRRFSMRAVYQGQQLGSNTYRESISFDFAKVGLGSRTAPAANIQAIVETLNFVVEDPGPTIAGVTVDVITTRDFTPLNV